MEQYYITPQSFDEDLRKLSHDSKRRAPIRGSSYAVNAFSEFLRIWL